MRTLVDLNMEKYQIQCVDYEKELEIARLARLAAEAVHCAFEARTEVDEVNRIIETGNWNSMFACLQSAIGRHRDFIVGLSPVTNLMVVNLRKDDVPLLTVEILTKQLQIMQGFIYAHYALSGVCRIAFQECFSKMFKSLMVGKS